MTGYSIKMLKNAIMCTLCFLTMLHCGEARQCLCAAPSSDSHVNIRSCASTSCEILGSLAPSECVDYRGESSAPWHNVNYEEQSGWIHGDYASGPQTCGGGDMCISTYCSSYSENTARGCDPMGCGHYGARRGSSRKHGGLDIRCEMGDTVVAPFEGVLVRKASPYGDGSCCDTGFLFRGTGDWEGYETKTFYCEPDANRIGDHFNAGEAMAKHKGLHCGCYGSSMTDHVHFSLTHGGDKIDPTSFALC